MEKNKGPLFWRACGDPTKSAAGTEEEIVSQHDLMLSPHRPLEGKEGCHGCSHSPLREEFSGYYPVLLVYSQNRPDPNG